MKKQTRQVGELALIESIRREFAGRRSSVVRLGIGDDCAILRPPAGCEILITTDFSLEGRHFRRDWHSPESIGHRCLARGLSDLAAMGATPMAAFLSLALPLELRGTWTRRFLHGFRALADVHAVPLAGGDTAQSPAEMVVADIVLVGAAPAGRALRRSGARAGDLLYVSGALGGAAAELERMRTGKVRLIRTGSSKQHPQMFPEPRLAAGQSLLRKGLATACIDLSDGLSTDLAHLCLASGVGAEVDAARLPIHGLAAGLPNEEALRLALDGGEDYELLFTAPATMKMPRRIAGVAITAVGRIVSRRKGLTLTGDDGTRKPLRPGGWEHFKS
ncbi:thiamine-phosphate kinase [Granulicella arctica]|uniref:thiamine-phosphate kinase n=1 Tax=Granulicella arctica TaxID=940613 RepID=UPI0021DF4941|nr:thiamine-phosphate kinase [Granulicella arctica]